MKRFYGAVATSPGAGGVGIDLDGRPARTPGKRLLRLPNPGLAEAVAREWAEQGADIDPASMPLTGLANGAIDRVAGNRSVAVSETVRYGETDLVCYRAAGPAALRAAQARSWGPLVDWMRRRHGIALAVTDGILPVSQPQLADVAEVVGGHGDFALAGLRAASAICGSVVIALALAAGRIDAGGAWRASQLDETWQLEKWGEDADATARRVRLRADLDAAAAFLELAANG